MNTGYNPEFNPTGIEGGVDTNFIPWIDLPQAPGMSIKPLRASSESGEVRARSPKSFEIRRGRSRSVRSTR